ncbi:MAG: methylenetetrahydrofolate reductase [Dermatophilus congolensis]|nr:methylenetetrahydrofolate reductase [Dermatophilus congolensis]
MPDRDRPAPLPTRAADGTSRFRQVIADGEGELLLFGITPPRLATPPERLPAIADATLARLDNLALDALLLYDIADETSRTDIERPYPFVESWDPDIYFRNHLNEWDGQAIVYRCVGKYDTDQIGGFLGGATDDVATVFVGAASATQPVKTSLQRAYQVHSDVRPAVPLGGVAIPERHTRKGDEHRRLMAKVDAGCSYFVTQVVFDVRAAKDLASDYAYTWAEERPDQRMAPLIFTMSLCGSIKSMEFIEWLGVDVPRWVRNELVRAHDPLTVSLSHSLGAARELARFCRHLGIPFGFSVESVSNRKVEIEASVELARLISADLNRPRLGPLARISQVATLDGETTQGHLRDAR